MMRTAADPVPSEGAVVTKAALRAAGLLALSNKVLARTVGLSEASVSRMGSGSYVMNPGDKAYELAVMFIRFYRALDALADGDARVARAWIASPNAALGGTPAELIQTLSGLVHAVAYLDARRALV
jgi:hypothetical protein